VHVAIIALLQIPHSVKWCRTRCCFVTILYRVRYPGVRHIEPTGRLYRISTMGAEQMSILVTGGAGYIGSTTVELLRLRGKQVVVLDDLFRGDRTAVHPEIPFYQGKVGDVPLVIDIARRHRVEACIHFAALAYVAESVAEPSRYFENNVAQGILLMNALRDAGIRCVVFSSTCATYGEPKTALISEDHPQAPTNPYGWSKFFMERILESLDAAYGLRFVALRYFNAAGATMRCGENHQPETHLIPNVLAAADGRLPSVSVFGQTYPTPDGTAIRDYIHVADLAAAHILALDHLRTKGTSEFINLGNGKGYSVFEIIETARKVTCRDIRTTIEPPRPGDPSHLIADAAKARRVLGWEPRYTKLEQIIHSAWLWHQRHGGRPLNDDLQRHEGNS
jgi:UDP-glucose 4-epimerase